MKNEIIIKADRQSQDNFCWLEVNEDSLGDSGRGPLSEIVSRVKGRIIVVLLPGEDVLLTSASIPGSSRFFQQAIPYALEEELAGDIAELHFAHLKKKKAGKIAVAVVSVQKMEACLQTFAEVGLRPDLLVPDILALPFDEKVISLAVDGDIALVRIGEVEGFAVDLGNLEQLVLPELERLDSPVVNLYNHLAADLSSDTLKSRVSEVKSTEQTLLETVAEGGAYRSAINLMQGRFSPKSTWFDSGKTWRLPLVLLIVCMALNFTNMALDIHALKAVNREMEQRITTLFRDSFPDSRRFSNARTQMEYKLKLLRNSKEKGDNLVWLLKRSAPIIFRLTADSLQSMRYRTRKLDLKLHVADFQTLESLKIALATEIGLEVAIQSAVAIDDYVSAEIEIRGKSNEGSL